MSNEERKAAKAERRRQSNIDDIIRRAEIRERFVGGEEYLPTVGQDCKVLADEVKVLREMYAHLNRKHTALSRAVQTVKQLA